MVKRLPKDLIPGEASNESIVHASDSIVDLSRGHKEGDISRLQSAAHNFDDSKQYKVDDLVIYDDKLYRNETANTPNNPWDDTQWKIISGGGSNSGKLSDLEINTDKDWQQKIIKNHGTAVGDKDLINKGDVDSAITAGVASKDSLSKLTDTEITEPANDQVLTRENDKWINKNLPPNNNTETLEDLTDTDIETPLEDQSLVRGADGKWRNEKLSNDNIAENAGIIHDKLSLADSITNDDLSGDDGKFDKIKSIGTQINDLNMGDNKVTNVKTPIDDTDATSKAYVVNEINKVKVKHVAIATTQNITLSGLLQIDDFFLQVGDRILVKNQADKTENGLYVVSNEEWPRTDDADTGEKLELITVFVINGSINGGNDFTCITPNITLGTTDIEFTEINSLLFGNGLQKNTNTVSVKPNGATIDVSGEGIKIADNSIGNSKIKNGSIDDSKIADNANITIGKILKGDLGTVPTSTEEGLVYIQPTASEPLFDYDVTKSYKKGELAYFHKSIPLVALQAILPNTPYDSDHWGSPFFKFTKFLGPNFLDNTPASATRDTTKFNTTPRGMVFALNKYRMIDISQKRVYSSDENGVYLPGLTQNIPNLDFPIGLTLGPDNKFFIIGISGKIVVTDENFGYERTFTIPVGDGAIDIVYANGFLYITYRLGNNGYVHKTDLVGGSNVVSQLHSENGVPSAIIEKDGKLEILNATDGKVFRYSFDVVYDSQPVTLGTGSHYEYGFVHRDNKYWVIDPRPSELKVDAFDNAGTEVPTFNFPLAAGYGNIVVTNGILFNVGDFIGIDNEVGKVASVQLNLQNGTAIITLAFSDGTVLAKSTLNLTLLNYVSVLNQMYGAIINVSDYGDGNSHVTFPDLSPATTPLYISPAYLDDESKVEEDIFVTRVDPDTLQQQTRDTKKFYTKAQNKLYLATTFRETLSEFSNDITKYWIKVTPQPPYVLNAGDNHIEGVGDAVDSKDAVNLGQAISIANQYAQEHGLITEYSTSQSYEKGIEVSFNGIIQRAAQKIPFNTPYDPTHWTPRLDMQQSGIISEFDLVLATRVFTNDKPLVSSDDIHSFSTTTAFPQEFDLDSFYILDGIYVKPISHGENKESYQWTSDRRVPDGTIISELKQHVFQPFIEAPVIGGIIFESNVTPAKIENPNVTPALPDTFDSDTDGWFVYDEPYQAGVNVGDVVVSHSDEHGGSLFADLSDKGASYYYYGGVQKKFFKSANQGWDKVDTDYRVLGTPQDNGSNLETRTRLKLLVLNPANGAIIGEHIIIEGHNIPDSGWLQTEISLGAYDGYNEIILVVAFQDYRSLDAQLKLYLDNIKITRFIGDGYLWINPAKVIEGYRQRIVCKKDDPAKYLLEDIPSNRSAIHTDTIHLADVHSVKYNGDNTNTYYPRIEIIKPFKNLQEHLVTKGLGGYSRRYYDVNTHDSNTPELAQWDKIHSELAVNAVTKVDGDNIVFDRHAVSSKPVAGGNGYLEFVVQTKSDMIVGLRQLAGITDADDINFALQFTATQVIVTELGIGRHIETYDIDDTFKIVMGGSLIKYYQNDDLIYTSLVTLPAFPAAYFPQVFMQSIDAVISDVTMYGYEIYGTPVIWDKLNSTLVTDAVIYVGDENNYDDAISTQLISSGDGYVEFEINNEARIFVGLSNLLSGKPNTSNINFSLFAINGKVSPYSYGEIENYLEIPYVSGDKFKIAIEGNDVKCYHNNVEFYTFLDKIKNDLYPYHVDITSVFLPSIVSNVIIKYENLTKEVYFNLQEGTPVSNYPIQNKVRKEDTLEHFELNIGAVNDGSGNAPTESTLDLPALLEVIVNGEVVYEKSVSLHEFNIKQKLNVHKLFSDLDVVYVKLTLPTPDVAQYRVEFALNAVWRSSGI